MSEDENVYIEDNDIQNDDFSGELESAGSETTGGAFGGLNGYSNLNNNMPKPNIPGKKNQAPNLGGNLAKKGDKVPEALKKRKNGLPLGTAANKVQSKMPSKSNNAGSSAVSNQSGGQAGGKGVVNQAAEAVAEKGGSAALQAAGVPKPIADMAAKKLAGPMVKNAKRKIMLYLIGSVAAFFAWIIIISVAFSIILMPILKGLELVDDISDSVSNFFSSAGHWLSGDGWCPNDSACISKAEEKFYDKVEKVSKKYPSVDMPLLLSSVLYGINTEGKFDVGNTDYCENYTDEDKKKECEEQTLSTEESAEIENNADLDADEKIEAYKDAKANITKVAKKLSKGKEEYDKYMLETFIPNNYRDYMVGGMTSEQILDEIYLLAQLFQDFKNMIGISRTGRICTYTVKGNDLKNVKIRLLACKGAEVEYGEVLPGEELVDLEKFVLGGTAQEIGADSPEEAIKAQAIAIRSYVLRRSEKMGGAYNLDIDYQNNIVNIRACTDDLAYCDPDKGCWSDGLGGEGQQTIHTGVDKSKYWSKDPIPEDAKIREIVASTAGMVGLQSTGEIAYTPFMQPEQTRWIGWANSGMDYVEILKKEYSGGNGGDVISTVKANCTSGLSGEWDTWKQGDSRWGSMHMGPNCSKTIGNIGCLVTSISIQVARSGTQINLPAGVTEFNPGVFITKNPGMFNGCLYNGSDSGWQDMAPNFKIKSFEVICGSNKEKIQKVGEYVNQGYYLVMRVKYVGEHWVAVTGVNANDIEIIDPAYDTNEFFSYYTANGQYNSSNCLRTYVFERTD